MTIPVYHPSWALVIDNMKSKNKQEEKDKNNRSQVIIPYMEGVSERVDWVLKKYGVATQRSDDCWST